MVNLYLYKMIYKIMIINFIKCEYLNTFLSVIIDNFYYIYNFYFIQLKLQ